jgi:hypothetical protein
MPVAVLMDELSLVSIPQDEGREASVGGVGDTDGGGREDCS